MIQRIGQCSEVPSEVTPESFALTRMTPETEDTHTAIPKPEPVSTGLDDGTSGFDNSNGVCWRTSAMSFRFYFDLYYVYLSV